MFFTKEKAISLEPLLQLSKQQLQQAQKGDFEFQYEISSENEVLQEVISNFKQTNELREVYECKLRQKLMNLTTINNVGFWEMDLPNGDFFHKENARLWGA